MFYTVLDADLEKVFSGSFVEVHTWFESKTYSEVYYVFNHQQKEFMTGLEFFSQGIGG